MTQSAESRAFTEAEIAAAEASLADALAGGKSADLARTRSAEGGSLATLGSFYLYLNQTSETVAFADIAPKTPVHLLVIPARHVDSIAGVAALDEAEPGPAAVPAARRAAPGVSMASPLSKLTSHSR